MDPVMIVTGASRGIGAATARLAARDGFDVCVNYLAATDAAESVAAQVRQAGRRALIVQGDMGREADILRLFETVDRELGRPTAVVINAGGVSGTRRRIDELGWDDLERTVTLNLIGAIGCCREAVRRASRRPPNSPVSMARSSK
jgi:NAD(P)-dependent dehydrogenase (short-subunit alcohol dehydrogenase family)